MIENFQDIRVSYKLHESYENLARKASSRRKILEYNCYNNDVIQCI